MPNKRNKEPLVADEKNPVAADPVPDAKSDPEPDAVEEAKSDVPAWSLPPHMRPPQYTLPDGTVVNWGSTWKAV